MDPLYIEATEDTPEINFNPEENIFSVSDRSLPENAVEFYMPVFQWLEEYSKNPKEKTYFDFKLDYFNTASAKQITKILLFLEKMSEKHNVEIRWFYRKEDIDMQSSGSRYAKLINVPFKLVEF